MLLPLEPTTWEYSFILGPTSSIHCNLSKLIIFPQFIFVLTYAAVHVGDPSKQPWNSLIHTHAHPPHSRTPMHAHTFHPCIPMHTHIQPHTPTQTCTSSRKPTHIPHIPAHALNLIKKKGRNKSQWTKKISCSKYQCLKQACISDAT